MSAFIRQMKVMSMSLFKAKISFNENSKLYDKLVKELPLMKNSFVKAGILEDVYDQTHPGRKSKTKREKARAFDFGSPNSSSSLGASILSGALGGGNKATIGQVAFWNEFGTRTIPSRPFMRSSFDTNKAFYNRQIEIMRSEVLSARKTVESSLKKLGFMMRTKIVERIDTAMTWAKKKKKALSPSTVKSKEAGALRGPNQPLIDSGKLRSSVDFEVVIK